MRSMVAILWLFGILSMADIPGIPTLTIPLWLQWAMVVSIGFLKALAWTALLILCRRNVFARCVAVGLIVVFALLSIANVTSYMLYGFGVSYKLMVVLAQTNADEVAGFLPGLVANLLRTRTLLLSLAAVGLIALTAWAVRLLSRRAWLWVCGVMCMLGFGGGVWMVTCRTLSKSVISVYGRTAKYSIKIYRDNRKCRDLIHAGTPFPNPELITTDGKPLSVVMIIGESASRDALSIYGFPLATTPEFDAMRDSLAVFTDAIGASSLTALNMERLLTFKRDTDEDAHWNTFPRLLDMMNKAGFKTFWFDSQEREGKWSDCSGIISSEADVVRYTCAQSSEEHSRHKYDTDLLPLFAKALADTAANKFVVLHLIGSHTNYADRYPLEFNHFNADSVLRRVPKPWLTPATAQVVAEYANSIRFTDAILGGIIRDVARDSRPVLVVYFSDHGENVYTDRDFRGRDPKFVRVPFIIYANASYRADHPQVMQAIYTAIHRPFSTANIPYTIMTLSGINHPIYDPSIDPLSTSFRPLPRYVNGSPFDTPSPPLPVQ